jgi:arabinose-5-phosphate isomerase
MITYFDTTMKILEKSIRSMDMDVFEKLVVDCMCALEKGNKVIASGLGKNVPVCDKFVGSLLSLGQSAGFMHTNSAVHGDLGMVQDGDVVIVLTKSGETVESVLLVDLLEKRDVIIWLLSFSKDSTLSRRLQGHCLLLDLEHEGDQWNIAPNNSTTVNLIVLQGLAMELVRRRGFTLEGFKRNHPGGHIGAMLREM